MIPKYQFIKSTDRCDEIFPPDVGEETPVVLKDVKKTDFEALLKFMYPIGFTTPKMSDEESVSILKLSSRWAMYKLRKLVIDSLSHLPWTVKVKLAREYGILEWLKCGYEHFTMRGEALSIDEANDLGLDITLSHPAESIVDKTFSGELKESQACTMSVLERFLLAKQLGVTEWLRSAYLELTARRESISLEEAKLLGLSTTIKLCSAREAFLQNGCALATPYSVQSYRTWVSAGFKQELTHVRRTEEQCGRPLSLSSEPNVDSEELESSRKIAGKVGAKKKLKK
ncbi:hypothetical protein H0H81_004140 [Sphagnurus paluster]|uniref:BTB domain-containing protein n=1 Tax=Sphagnurus paluster TaxID=117069 RepID=A0A9P7FWG4_9AGAR|nr:hypothetical protein H0H81_004140 [Sphagnurus paluster]